MDRYFSKVRARASSDAEDDPSPRCDPESPFEQSAEEDSFNSTPVAGPSKPPKKKVCRQYMDSYLSLGFTWTGDENVPRPMCLICGEKLYNSNMVPSKTKRHLLSKHGNLVNKDVQYFERLLEQQKCQRSDFEKRVTVSDKMQIVSYQVAELIAQQTKPHTIAEKLIQPACSLIVKTLFGDDAEREVMEIPLSDNTIRRRIVDMSANIEKRVSESMKNSKFAIQVDESTDISGKAQLLAYIRFIHNDEIITQFLFCKELEKHTRGQDIFQTLSEYLEKVEISWDSCIGICTDGAPCMIANVRGLAALIKQKNPDVISTHCFLHREALITKTLVADLKLVLDQTVRIVNFIKAKPLEVWLFAQLCKRHGIKTSMPNSTLEGSLALQRKIFKSGVGTEERIKRIFGTRREPIVPPTG